MTKNRLFSDADRTERLQKVALLVREAHDILQELRAGEHLEDVAYFHSQLREFLAADNGQAGFERYVHLFVPSEAV